MPPRRLFALDQGFPQNILNALKASIREAELDWIGDIDASWSDLEDWEILVGLYRHRRAWDGLITTDSSMLRLPREMAVLVQTKLTLVVAEGAGHDPILATGLLLTHLPHICSETDPKRSQVWRLRANRRPAEDTWEYIKSWGKQHKESPKSVFQRFKIERKELEP